MKTEVHAAPFENPLIPNKRLCTLYTAMAELRLLESFATSRTKRTKLPTTIGLEACRASTAINLEPGDLTSEANPALATAFLRGTKLKDLLAEIASQAPSKAKSKPATEASASTAKQDPTLPSGKEHLYFALGRAQSLAAANAANKKSAELGRVLLTYVHPSDLSSADWTEALSLASRQNLPILLVAFPDPTLPADKLGRLSRNATTHGVPGILVDAADPVAIYRVMQESLERARHGNGPVLMETIPFHPDRKQPVADPIATMAKFLLDRRIVDEKWMESIEQKFLKRLQA